MSRLIWIDGAALDEVESTIEELKRSKYSDRPGKQFGGPPKRHNQTDEQYRQQGEAEEEAWKDRKRARIRKLTRILKAADKSRGLTPEDTTPVARKPLHKALSGKGDSRGE